MTTRAIGDADYKREIPPENAEPEWYLHNHALTAYPDVMVRPLTNDIEFIILACDGIWDCRTSQEVVDHFKKVLP